MSSITGQSSARSTRRAMLTISTAGALALSGCVNPVFRESTATFGQLTKATVAAQNAELAAVLAAEQERIRSALAQGRADLRISGNCPQLLSQREGVTAAPCTLERLMPDGRRIPVEQAAQFENILALSAALSTYADSLVTLAGDFSENEEAFTAAVAGVATSIGNIDRVISQVTGQRTAELETKLGAVAGLVARLGNLYFAHERNRVLKQIIIDGDDFVQEAVALLAGVDAGQRLYRGNRLYTELADAQNAASRIIASGGSAAEVRAAQDILFDRLAAYNRINSDMARFRAIGEAHARLREAAEDNLSTAELREAIRALIDLAGATHETVTTLRQPTGSSNNGDQN